MPRTTLDRLVTLDKAVRIVDAVDRLRNAGGPGSTVTFSSGGRSTTVHADTAERRIERATDRLDPDTGAVLSEHEAMERLVGLEAAVSEVDRHIAAKKADLKILNEERENRLSEIRALIRIPTPPAPTPLFDGDPT